ncbi:MAG: hypothetical protein GTO55_07800 [Armatimonadetes bacterium]|nr:hypothetical protein [Armatimonadota bacterium]NIM24167.1 hypothetical protein [Armatimonadota bacterium]NIM68026.1 hypothetical protein [Armatimonadota bacterium]NIM76521.1 hypothetical protein [Armatimonadota bacterium]NIN06260.1 hypothetical protein [Armatimonadota bacterium]
MKVIVHKFGGTCVESEESQLLSAERIMEAKDHGLHPIVAVSAAGRMGQPYSTAELVGMVTRIDPHIRPRELDLLMSCGEIISTVAMAHLLSAKGYDTIALTGGQAGLITDVYHGHAQIIRIDPQTVLQALQQRKIVFVAGFQGISENHDITTLGEGGSDYTAVALAVVLSQTGHLPFGDELEMAPVHIFKEVDGVMSANPKNFVDCAENESPHVLTRLSYDECVEMSGLGAEVIQNKAARMARKHKVPLMVRNFRRAEVQGTKMGEEPAPTPSGKATSVADMANLALFTIKSDNARLSGQLAEHLNMERLTHFVMGQEDGEVRFAVKREKYRDVIDLVGRVLFLRGMKADIMPGGYGLVSLVGERLRGEQAGLQDLASGTLKEAGIEVLGTICGDLSISYLVGEDSRAQSVKLLHSRFCSKE